MSNRPRLYRLIVVASCFWWFGVVFFHTAELTWPDTMTPIPLIDIYKMTLVRDIAPWMMLPFIGVVLLRLMASLRGASVAVPPIWLTWACAAAALMWTAFALWRAHDQAFTCAVWRPTEAARHFATCSLPHLVGSVALWLVIPIAAWLLLAAAPLRSPAASRSRHQSVAS